MTKGITEKQQALLDCIKEFIEAKGYSPTVREICEKLDLSSPSTVQVHLNSLEKKGMLKRDPMKSRSIILSPAAYGEGAKATERPFLAVEPAETAPEPVSGFKMPSNVIAIPLVGDVAAGQPILAEQNIVDTYYLPTDMVSNKADFMLKVHGQSMIEAGINDGDYVVVRSQNVADNGEIVVAIIEDGATVKRFYKESDHIRLQPENSAMEPILVDACVIAGKVVAVFRRL